MEKVSSIDLKPQPPADPLEELIALTHRKLKEAELRGEFLAQKSLILALRDLELSKRKAAQEANTLEERFAAFCDDSELQIYCLDQMARGGRGWNKNCDCWWNKRFAEQAAIHARKQALEERQRR